MRDFTIEFLKCGPVPFAVTPHTEHPPRAVTSTVIRWALKSHLFRCTFIKTFYRYILITGNLDVDLQAIACVHSLQYSTVQYSKALPPFRKRKQNTSTTKDSGLQQRQKKTDSLHITATTTTASATVQLQVNTILMYKISLQLT